MAWTSSRTGTPMNKVSAASRRASFWVTCLTWSVMFAASLTRAAVAKTTAKQNGERTRRESKVSRTGSNIGRKVLPPVMKLWLMINEGLSADQGGVSPVEHFPGQRLIKHSLRHKIARLYHGWKQSRLLCVPASAAGRPRVFWSHGMNGGHRGIQIMRSECVRILRLSHAGVATCGRATNRDLAVYGCSHLFARRRLRWSIRPGSPWSTPSAESQDFGFQLLNSATRSQRPTKTSLMDRSGAANLFCCSWPSVVLSRDGFLGPMRSKTHAVPEFWHRVHGALPSQRIFCRRHVRQALNVFWGIERIGPAETSAAGG